MDTNGSSLTGDEITKSDTGQVTGRIVNALDALAPAFAPFAARWDAEADRRRQLRTPEHLKALMDAQRAHNSARATAATAKHQRQAARKASKNPLSTARRSARTADKAARGRRAEAKAALAQARRDYPQTLTRAAVKAHAVHAVPAAMATYAMSSAADWTTWPAAVSAGLIGLNAAALWLGRRSVTAALPEDGLSAEERQLMKRLDPAYWVAHAPERGLDGTITGTPEITGKGVVCEVRLDGRWDLPAFVKQAARVRALLGARTDTPMRITAGSQGDWARITLRTRSAVGTAPIPWTPTTVGIGLDVETGEPVTMPTNERMLFAGSSGSGKSTSLRPLMADVVRDELSALAMIDIKRVEAGLWRPRARVAVTYGQAEELAAELKAEMYDRLKVMETEGQDLWQATPQRPRIVLIVDEGTLLMSGPKGLKADVVELGLAGRAAEIVVWWCTQKPLMADTPAAGIPTQLAGQMDVRAALKLASATDCRTVFGDDATEKGWDAHLQPKPGYLMVRGTGRGPVSIKTWYMVKEDVKALPEREPWHRPGDPGGSGGAPAPLALVKVPAPTPAAEDEPVTNRARVLRAVRDGATTVSGVAKTTGINKGTVSGIVRGLVDAGELARAEDGTLIATAGEASA